MNVRLLLVCVAPLLLWLVGCTSEAPPPANYAGFEPANWQWVLKVEGVAPADVEKLRVSLEAVQGVKKGSVQMNMEGNWVAFETTMKDASAHGSVAGEARKKLEEFNLQVGESKTKMSSTFY